MAITRIFIDSRVNDQDSLISQFASGTEYSVLDASRDGIEQMVAALAGHGGYDSLQIISHGAPGSVTIGSTVLDSSTLGFYADQLAQIGRALTDTGDLLLYGCNVAAGDQGRQFIETLSQMTGADVAASDDATGSTAAGGDWVLEVSVGQVDATALNVAVDVGVLGVNTAPTFNTMTGKVQISGGGGTDMAIALNGDILFAGWSSGLYGQFMVNLNASGVVSKVFNTPNVRLSPPAFPVLQLDSSGNVLMFGSSRTTTAPESDIAITRWLPTGQLDSSLNGTGNTLVNVANIDWVGDAAIQADGKFLISLYRVGDIADVVLARINTNGSLDTSFGEGGKVTTPISQNQDIGYAIAVQPDGKFLVSGSTDRVTTFNTISDNAVVRYNTDGSLDATFSDDGMAITPYTGNHQGSGHAMVIQPDGKILAIRDGSLSRYNSNGSIDASFNGNGVVNINLQKDFMHNGGMPEPVGLALQSDGKIIVAGSRYNVISSDIVITRLNSDGSLDNSFAGDGEVMTDFGGNNDYAYSVQVQADGKIVVLGGNNNNHGSYMQDNVIVARYNTDGSLDAGFGTAQTLNASVSCAEHGAAVVLDNDVEIFDQEVSNGGWGSFAGTTLTLSRHGGTNPDDVFHGSGTLTLVGSDMLFGYGTATQSNGTLTINFTSGEQAGINAVMQRIAYSNTSDTPPASVQIDWVFSDGNTGSQGIGGPLTAKGSTTVTFLVAPDATAPILLTSTPDDNAIGVSVHSNLVLTFDENVQAGTGNILITDGSDERTIEVSDSTQVTFDGSTVTINPANDLHAGSRYHVGIEKGAITDGTGNAFVGISDATALDFATEVINNAPASTDGIIATDEDTAKVLSLTDFGTYSDAEGTALAKVQITTLESAGALQYYDGTNWTDVMLNQEITATDITAGELRFEPVANATGSAYALLGYKVSDGLLYSANAYTLTVNVTAVNDAPTVSGPLVITVSEGDSSVSFNLLANAHDVDLTDTLSVGSVSYTVNGVPSALPAGMTMNGNTLTIDSSSTVYTATAQGEQTTIVATYQVLDSAATATAEISFATKVDYATGTGPSSVTSADVNGDGKLDLIVANYYTVSVLNNNGDGSFAQKVDYLAGSRPISVTSADVNGDSELDLIVANQDSGTVSVLKNSGDGTFAMKVDYVTGASPQSVTIADVNSDGKLDMVFACYNSGTVSVLQNNGDGTFAEKVHYATGNNPRSVTSADVNGDGKSDLIVANQNSRTVSVLQNNGDGTFATKVDYATGYQPWSVTSADVNGDGMQDLIVANSYSDTVSVLQNNGDGTFAATLDYATGNNPCSVTSADLNGDGKSDLMVANTYGNTVSLLRNNGDGTFATKVDYTTGSWPASVTSADVTGDGKIDLIVANLYSSAVSVLINDSTGFSAYPTTMATITINGANDAPVVTNTAEAQQGSVTEAGYLVSDSGPTSGTLTASDVDTDATQTWSIADTTPASTYGSIAINATSGVWAYTLDDTKAATQALHEGETVTQSYTARVTDELGAFADQTITVTIHGTNDAPVSSPFATTVAEGAPSVSLNLLANAHDVDLTDKLSVGSVSYTVHGAPSALPAGITMNGTLLTIDPANTEWNAMAQGEQTTIVATYRVFDSVATAEISFATKIDYATGSVPYSVTSADVNGDGKPDLIFANPNSNTVSVLKNNGDGTFTTKVDYAAGAVPYSVTSSDVNGDGKPDLIVANPDSNTVSVLKNNGNGTFATKVDYATEYKPISVTSAEVTGDGKPDLIVANRDSNTLSVLKNNGDGTFATQVRYATGSNPDSVTSAEVNGDGKLDLIVAHSRSHTVSVLKNNGDGTFATKVDYASGYYPYSVTGADVNGDGKPDLIVANQGSNTVSVLKNKGDGTFAMKVDYATGYNSISVTSADVNGDGKLDLIVANLVLERKPL